MKIISKIFWFIWGLPQNLIGFIMYCLYDKSQKTKYNDAYVVWTNQNWGGAITFGMFIFVYADFGMGTENMLKHEYGHTIQSKILGPLYLLVIGLPSIIWAGLFRKYRAKHKISYYSLYTEKWANKLGGVE